MAFEPENALEDALVRAGDDAEAAAEFYQLLLESDLLVIGERVPVAGEQKPDGFRLRLATLAMKEQTYLPVFTSLVRLRSFISEESEYLVMLGRDLFANTRGAHFVLNPGDAYATELIPEDIEALLRPAEVRRFILETPTRVTFGQPITYPTALTEALSQMFSAHPEVLSAYLAQIVIEGRDGEEPHPLIGIESLGAVEPLLPEIERVADTVAPGVLIDIMPIAYDPADDASRELLRTTPFFARTATLN